MSDLGNLSTRGDRCPSGYLSKLVHELRTPLTALRGSLGLLASVIDDASPEVKSFASIAERNASRLASMLDDLAELERIRGGSVAATPETIDVADLVDEVTAAEQARARQAGIELHVDIEAGDVEADPALLKHLVARILRYAIQMSVSGTTVRIHARRDGAGAVLEIIDTGKAVDETASVTMFEPFSLAARRGPDASVRPGLSLAIVWALADLLGVTLAFTSSPAGGHFRLTFNPGLDPV